MPNLYFRSWLIDSVELVQCLAVEPVDKELDDGWVVSSEVHFRRVVAQGMSVRFYSVIPLPAVRC